MTEGVAAVEQLLDAHQGVDVLPAIRKTLKSIGSELKRQQVVDVLAKDPGWSFYHPDVVWDMSKTGGGDAAHGVVELARWWSGWVESWTRYVYTVGECSPLQAEGVEGELVLTRGEVEATARNGQTVKMPVWQTWKVHDGRVTAMRAFLKEAEARESAV